MLQSELPACRSNQCLGGVSALDGSAWLGARSVWREDAVSVMPGFLDEAGVLEEARELWWRAGPIL